MFFLHVYISLHIIRRIVCKLDLLKDYLDSFFFSDILGIPKKNHLMKLKKETPNMEKDIVRNVYANLIHEKFIKKNIKSRWWCEMMNAIFSFINLASTSTLRVDNQHVLLKRHFSHIINMSKSFGSFTIDCIGAFFTFSHFYPSIDVSRCCY